MHYLAVAFLAVAASAQGQTPVALSVLTAFLSVSVDDVFPLFNIVEQAPSLPHC